jgi:phage terminase large subunit GpA-like protein
MLSVAMDTVADALARGLQPDPNLPLDEWADRYMIIPKSSGANEYGKYRTSRTPHAREVMRVLSDGHPCRRVALKGASQMLKSQVALNWLCYSVHQSPSNFLWLVPTGKLQKRASTRISKTFDAVVEVREKVAAPRSRDAINTLDTKEYDGGALTIATAGSAANLSELSVRRLVFDEIDRSLENVDGEGDPRMLGEGRMTTFARNGKAYYPCSPTIEGESIIDDLYQLGTKREALADCIHCGFAQPLVFERLQRSADGQTAMYPCMECGAFHYESDKNRMFARGAWSDGVEGDRETESFTINAMFLPYGWVSWLTLLREYDAAKEKLDAGSDTLMTTFYNTRLARCWARAKEKTRHEDLMNRAEQYRLGSVPAGGLVVTASIDTQDDRLEFKAVAWGEHLEAWVVDVQILHGDPAEQQVWAKAEQLLTGRYRHACGEMLGIEAVFIDSGGHYTQEVYNFAHELRRRGVQAVKGSSKPGRPIISAKPTLVDVSVRGKAEKFGGKLWFVGTDTAKDYLAGRWKLASGPGAIHFPTGLSEEYYRQLAAEYRVTKFRRGHKVTVWEKKPGDRNEALDLMVYNLAAAHHLGLHRKSEYYWERLREKLNPRNLDMFKLMELAQPEPLAASVMTPLHEHSSTNSVAAVVEHAVAQTIDNASEGTVLDPAKLAKEVSRVAAGRISLKGTRRGAA